MSAHSSRAGAPRATTAAVRTPSTTGAHASGARRSVLGALALSLAAGLTGAPALALDDPLDAAGTAAVLLPGDVVPTVGEDVVEVLPPGPPAASTARGTGDGQVEVSWGAGASTPGAPGVSGYAVTAVGTGVDTGVTVRTGAEARSAVLEGLLPGGVYRVEVAAFNSAGTSAPAVVRVRASQHVVPTAQAYTLRRPSAEGKYPVLADGPSGPFGVQLDPAPGLLDPTIHFTVDGSAPTPASPVFVPLETAGITVRQDTTVRWIVVDSGNVVGPEGRRYFDLVESPHPAPVITRAATATVSGAVDLGFARLPEPPVSAYRVQAYTGDSADTLTGVRVGALLQFVPPADTGLLELTRRVTGLVNGMPYRFSVAARYGTTWTEESALSAAVTPAVASAAVAGADQTVLRGRVFTLDGSASPRAVSYQWTQVRPVPAPGSGLPQDPALDLNAHAAGVQTTTGAGTRPALTLTFPLMTTATSDHDLQFRLTTTHSDGSTRSDLVDVSGQADVVTADEVRWRDGDAISGTGSQDAAQLTLLDGGPTGSVIGTALVEDGEWSVPVSAAALTDGRLYVWSDHGHTGTVTTND